MPLSPQTYCVLMCGGEGTRFAPLSTPDCPKQFLRLFGTRSLLQETYNRCEALVPPQRVFASTNYRYVPLIREHLPQLPSDNIIAEPLKKNTAPALALAAAILARRDPEAIMVALPADHMIVNLATFQQALQTAERIAIDGDYLVTLGIRPDRPATEYGYICGGVPLSASASLVERFVEKPNHALAVSYLANGRYYWNSGMFIWRARRLLTEIAAHLPELDRAVRLLADRKISLSGHDPLIDDYFATAPEISIDYGVMERSQRVAMIPVECGWSDVGSWEGLREFVQREGLAVAPEVRPLLTQHG
ncbi:MAG: mannose-1-phosphate guanylyltransferase [Deltaproteobacteria bacterium]|nr:mannose-1-phosphate guanylyltransferase [Deltaproteobacteria bacterium]